ncbi:hypothetical protein [Streptomyces sp. NPDC048603]|uniref:hypothetical protein n=1 Tax=Streptomyces sp. NPDC048603 TaxID=3365577 RepID=UPI00371BAD9E
MNSKLRGRVAAVVVPAMAGAALLAAGGTAAAYGKDGYLENQEFGLYYLTDRSGCVFDIVREDYNFNDDKFTGPAGCHGRTDWTNDNTESYWNRHWLTWKVATDAGIDGNVGTIPEAYWGNASSTFKNKISSADYILGT